MNKGFYVIFVFTILLAFFIAVTYIPKANVLCDEGTHLFDTYRVYRSLSAGSMSSFLSAIRIQTYYPPVQSLLLGPIFFLLGGFSSVEKARIVNLLFFIACSLLLYVMGKGICKNHSYTINGDLRELGAITGSLLFLTSPLIIYLASVYYREDVGIFISLLTVASYLQAKRKNTVFYSILTGVLLVVLTLTKYNYGLIFVAGFLLEGIVDFTLHPFWSGGPKPEKWLDYPRRLLAITKGRTKIIRTHLLIFVPYVILFGSWVFLPKGNYETIIKVLSDSIQYIPIKTDKLGYFLYYPRAIVLMYSASGIIGLFLLFSFVASLWYLYDFRIRTLWFLITVNLVVGIMHSNNTQERYIATTVPLLFLLGSFLFTRIWANVLRIKKTIKPLFWVLSYLGLIFLLKICIDLASVPNFIYALAAHSFASPVFNQVKFQETTFDYDLNGWNEKYPLPQGKYEKPQDVIDFITQTIDASRPVQVIGTCNEFCDYYISLAVALAKEKALYNPATEGLSYIATIEVLPTSRFHTGDYMWNAWKVGWIRTIEQNPDLTLIAKKTFEDIQVEVAIYRKPCPHPIDSDDIAAEKCL